MRFESFADLASMGGHGPYVWSTYALALVVIAANVLWPLVAARRNMKRVRRRDGMADQSQVEAGAK